MEIQRKPVEPNSQRCVVDEKRLAIRELTRQQYRELFELEMCFSDQARPTVGFEVELPIFDRESGLPTNSVQDVIDRMPESIQQQIHPELLKCTIEIVTGIHDCPDAAAADFLRSLDAVDDACDALGKEIRWQASFDFPIDVSMLSLSPRIEQILDRAGSIDLNKHGTHSMHVHVGVSRSQAMQVLNWMYAKMPGWISQAANSPAMYGSDGDWQSHRAKTWGLDLPICGFPYRFNEWTDYYELMTQLFADGLIECQKDAYLLARPSRFGTIECRGLDLPRTASQIVSLVEQVHTAAIECQGTDAVLPSLEVLDHEFREACRLGNAYVC